jgi:uncharacterized protein DUF3857
MQLSALLLLLFFVPRATIAQEPAPKPAEKPADKKVEKPSSPEKPENPAQIELLETRYRFEADGSSRKEVHTRVHINSELGVRQFARLNFDFNRAFQAIEIPLVHITHASGGTADILPSAITDNPNPAVVDAPAYQDVRVKTVRILGLEPGDTLEYRVITTTSHHPLAPDFWLDHSFDRTGVVSQEIFELDLPASVFEETRGEVFVPKITGPPRISSFILTRSHHAGRIYISPETPETSKERSGENPDARLIYKWLRNTPVDTTSAKTPPQTDSSDADLIVTTLTWQELASILKHSLYPFFRPEGGTEIYKKFREAMSEKIEGENYLETIYRFVSQKIRTVDLPLGSTGFRIRNPLDVLSSGYATAEEKAVLFILLLPDPNPACHFALFISASSPEKLLARPSLLTRILVVVEMKQRVFLDPAAEVAPYGVISANLRGKTMLMLHNPGYGQTFAEDPSLWQQSTLDLPFASSQKVSVAAALAADGKLTAKVHYSLRGDNELLLRIGFHQTPKDKWKDLAQLLSLSDGFRGEVTNVSASDPYATREPFTLDYEITQPKFVDWSKKPVRIPALLPQLGLPDPPAKPATGSATAPVELGTPLEVETHMTLHLPPGTTAHTPTGTSVVRDYATFASQYAESQLTVTASRHINFLSREVPAERATDYNAFLRAILSDEAQDFTLEHADTTTPKPAPKPQD